MLEQATDATWLRGKHVAFTGRLASMTRREAAALVEAYGGVFVSSISRHTSLLVVGQEGLPLTRRGALTRKLQKARKLEAYGLDIAILPEEEFFVRLGLTSRTGGVHRLYTTAQLCRLLRVSRRRLESWVGNGLVHPVETVHGVHFFEFQQVTAVKMLCELAQNGVKSKQIRRSLEQLRNWMHVEEPLAQLAVIERDGQLLVRLHEGQLAETNGQMQLDFSSDEPDAVIVESESGTRSADEWFDVGCDYEEVKAYREAAHAYRQALLVGGPNATVCFNLGNVLYAMKEKAASAERFRQAVEIDHTHAAAWNNLGNVLAERGENEEAVDAYYHALEVEPGYADLHYNLADTLHQLGDARRARKHWQTYVRLEPVGPWADYARKQLKSI